MASCTARPEQARAHQSSPGVLPDPAGSAGPPAQASGAQGGAGMSNFHVTAALKAKAGGPSEKLILFALANWADTNGFAYPGQESLAEIAELSERSVRRCIDRL